MLEVNQKLFDIVFKFWLEVKKFEQPTDVLLSKLFKENHKLNKQAKNIIAETIYTLLRNYLKLSKLTDSDAVLIMFVWLNYMNVPSQRLLSISAKLFNKTIELSKALDKDTLELPQWIVDNLIKHMSLEQIKLLDRAMTQQPDLTIRVNTLKISRKELMKLLIEQGHKVVETVYSPYGLVLKDKAALMNNELFLNGYFEVQDEASQLAGLIFDAKRGEMITDFCAGSGGKTFLMGMTMRNTGRIYAFDNNEKRLNNMKPRLSRSGLSNIYPQLIKNEHDSKLKRLEGKMDKVFVDAPCLGLGTIRRNPDLKFRQNNLLVSEITTLQLSILKAAAKLVKPGGSLLYATCSILREENHAVVNEFLGGNSDYHITDLKDYLDKYAISTTNSNYLELYPHIHNTDGFFCCVLKKN